MASDQVKKKGGCLGKLVGLFVLVILLLMGTGVYFATLPQDLSDIGGYNGQSPATAASPPRDLIEVIQKAIDGNYSVVISEKEMNQWIGTRLKAEQGGGLGEWVKLTGALLRLKDGVAEVVIKREVAGHPVTTSLFLQVEQNESRGGIATQVKLHGGGYHESLPMPTRGGRFGRLVVPQGFLILVMPDFRKLADVFQREIDLGFGQMAGFRIEDNRLVLDPSQPGSGVQTDGKSF